MILDFTAEDKYYYWLMISIGLDEELVGYIRDCAESDEEVSELILELYNDIQNRNALKRILYFSHIKSTEINKDSVETRIVNYFYSNLLNQTLTLNQIGEYLGKLYALEPEWTDFEWISENYSLAVDGIFSFKEADNRLLRYLKENSSINAEL